MKSPLALAMVVGGMISIAPGLANATYIFQQGVNGYDGTHDTELREKFPTTNYSTNPTMTIDEDADSGDLDDAQALLRFGNIFGLGAGQIEFGSTIHKATLTLFVENRGHDILMLQKLQGWDEGHTEWQDFGPDGVTDGNGEASFLRTLEGLPGPGLLSHSGVFIKIDVTEELQLWSDNGAFENFGWAFLPTDDNGVDFATSEAANINRRPKLSVRIVSEPGTLAVFGLGLVGLGYYRRKRSA